MTIQLTIQINSKSQIKEMKKLKQFFKRDLKIGNTVLLTLNYLHIGTIGDKGYHGIHDIGSYIPKGKDVIAIKVYNEGCSVGMLSTIRTLVTGIPLPCSNSECYIHGVMNWYGSTASSIWDVLVFEFK